ncbi:MAG TPA: hypothetical protein VME41_18320 [Stellaceae bacterium]|nr:hypothetical protein [Stellaceae bacterium]
MSAAEIAAALGPRASAIALSGLLTQPHGPAAPPVLRMLARLCTEAAAVQGEPGPAAAANEVFGATEFQVPPTAPAAVPPIAVLQLDKIEIGTWSFPLVGTPTGGFAALFGLANLPTPMLSLRIVGRVMIDDHGTRRQPGSLDKNAAWWPVAINNQVYMPRGRGAANATSAVTTVGDDGTFATESTVTTDPGTQRLHVQVQASLRGGRQITAEATLERNDLDVFLSIIEKQENFLVAPPPGLTHLQFLHAVRKIFQPPPGSPFAELFDVLLYRNHDIPSLFAPSTAEHSRLHRFENMEIAGQSVDIGHVLTAIEGFRLQQPQLGSRGIGPWHWPLLASDDLEATVTWGGDYGLALASYLEDKVNGKTVDIRAYVNVHAGIADLLGDIDGINIGAAYDEANSLGDNLRAYYGAKPLRRFHSFVANATDELGKPIFTLMPGQPKLDSASRQKLARYVLLFANRKLAFVSKITPAQFAAVQPIVQPGSTAPEIEFIADHFGAFIEAGLASEASP